MASGTRPRGAHYPSDGSSALKPDSGGELIRRAQEIRRQRLLEQRGQGIALRTQERPGRARRKHMLSRWAALAAPCILAALMLTFVMMRHLEVARGAIMINNLNAELKEVNAETERMIVEIAKAAEMDYIKDRAAAMGYRFPGEDKIIRVALTDTSAASALAPEDAPPFILFTGLPSR